MKRTLVGFLLGLLAATGIGYAITVNPASNVTADSNATAFTIPYRDANGDFAVNDLDATTISVASGTAAGVVTGRFRGAFSSVQLATLSASPGDFAFNTTITQMVLSSATSTALPGAWIMPSTSTVYTKLAGY